MEELQDIRSKHRQDSYFPKMQTKYLPNTSLEHQQHANPLNSVSYTAGLMYHETMLPTEMIIVLKIKKHWNNVCVTSLVSFKVEAVFVLS